MPLLPTTVIAGQAGHLADSAQAYSKLNKSHFDVEVDYGAVGDGLIDDTAAILAAHDAAKAAGGGILRFSGGKNYLCATELDLSSTANVTWLGAGGPSGSNPAKITYSGVAGSRKFVTSGSITTGTTTLEVTGGDFTGADVGRTVRINNAGPNGNWLFTKIVTVTDSDTVETQIPASATATNQTVMVGGSFIKLANSDSNWFRNLRIDYSSDSFYGDIFDFYSASGSNSAYNRFDHVRISGASSSVTAAARAINLSGALGNVISRSYFRYTNRGIQGNADYNHIEFCRFVNLGAAAIWNLRQACSVNGCTVTPCDDGSVRLYDYDNTDSIKIVSFKDIWSGDGVADTGTIIRFKGRYIEVNGGCQLTTGDTAVELVGGVSGATAKVDGYLGCTNGIKFTMPASTPWTNCTGAPHNASTNEVVTPENCSILRLPIHGAGTPSLPKTISTWTQENVAATQTDVALAVYGDTTHTGIPMVRAGSVTGVVVSSNAARAAGTLTVEVTIDGVKCGLTAVLNGSNTTTKATTQSPYLDTYTAGQSIGAVITTDGAWLPTTADIAVAIEVAE